jgi:hypothetical protein
MSIFSDLAVQLRDVLKQADGLSTMKTIETEIRECLFVGANIAQGFTPAELPAINFSLTIGTVKSEQFTAGEISDEIPLTIVVIDKATKGTAARDSVLDYSALIRAALQPLRRSGNVLGRNIFIKGPITAAPASIVHDKPYSFAWVTCDATLQRIYEL